MSLSMILMIKHLTEGWSTSTLLTCPDSVFCVIRWRGPSSGTGFTRAVFSQHVVKLSSVQGSKLSPERRPGRLDKHINNKRQILRDIKHTYSKTLRQLHMQDCKSDALILKKEPQALFVVIVRMTGREKQAFSHHSCFHMRKQSHCYSLICMQSIFKPIIWSSKWFLSLW